MLPRSRGRWYTHLTNLLAAYCLVFAFQLRRRLSQAKFLTAAERANLVFSGELITFIIGVRFLTDFLSGDTYFRTAYPEHNLIRARTQFKMVSSIESQHTSYQSIIDSL